jgi:hypothetical protein
LFAGHRSIDGDTDAQRRLIRGCEMAARTLNNEAVSVALDRVEVSANVIFSAIQANRSPSKSSTNFHRLIRRSSTPVDVKCGLRVGP